MLSKLTFSLVLVLVLALVAGSALAQTTVSDPVISAIGEKGFAVYEMDPGDTTPYENGITVITPITAVDNGAGDEADMPDLYDLLRLGGSIEVALNVGPKTVPDNTNVPNDADSDPDANTNYNTIASDGDTPADITAGKAAGFAYRVIITEVMWGYDLARTGAERALPQWVEIYNNGAALKGELTGTDGTGDEIILIFHASSRPDRVGEAITIGADQTDNADLAGTYVVTDQLSTINRFGGAWEMPGNSGRTAPDPISGDAPVDLASMYRKINLSGGKYKAKGDAKIRNQKTGVEQTTGLDGLGDGAEAGSWAASTGRVNMTGHFIGSPGSEHITIGGTAGIRQGFGKAPESIAATGVIINEVRNDSSDANLDWVELYYFDDTATATPQNIENWTLSIVTVEKNPDAGDDDYQYFTADPDDKKKYFKDTNLFHLPKFKLLPGDYLVIYNRHPGDTILAGGQNVEDILAGKQVNKGSSHLYIVREDWSMPSDMKFLLLLRNNHEKAGTHEKIVDYAGNGYFKRVETDKFNTDVWPMVGWSAPGDQDAADFGSDNTFADVSQSFGRGVELNDKGMWRPKSRADNRTHKDDIQPFGFMGTGYDRDVDPQAAPGTPGYENRAVSVVYDDRENAADKSAYMFGGTVTISEVMYDAGPRWNLIQWIELYNSSMTETVNLEGWTLEIRNKEDVESYVDSSFEFQAGAEVLPNQTLLIVSGTGANDVDSTRVYNLYANHRRELGLLARDSVLLSRTGFYLRLTSKIMVNGRELSIDDDLSASEMDLILMDEAGNVSVKGAERTVMWDLPARDPAARQSLVRRYGTAAIDGTPDPADDGLMESAWKQSDLTGAGLSYYGHRNDIGTPGFRLGGPLPVQLSSFRPVRNDVSGHVDITWVTQSELNNAGFNILRSEGKGHAFEVINVKGIVPGHGTTSEKHVYTFTDTTAKPNVVYYYQIEDVSLNGNRTTLRTTHLRGNVSAAGKVTTTWGDLKLQK